MDEEVPPPHTLTMVGIARAKSRTSRSFEGEEDEARRLAGHYATAAALYSALMLSLVAWQKLGRSSAEGVLLQPDGNSSLLGMAIAGVATWLIRAMVLRACPSRGAQRDVQWHDLFKGEQAHGGCAAWPYVATTVHSF